MILRHTKQSNLGFLVRTEVLFVALLLTVFGCSESSNPAVTTSGEGQASDRATSAPSSITVRLNLDEIRDQIPAQAKVFVFVREPGERMPIEVEAYDPTDIPKAIKFASPGQEMDVTVFARVSISGKVEKSPGDFEVSATTTYANPSPVVDLVFTQTKIETVGTGSISVTIDMAVPEEALSVFTDRSRVFVIAKTPGSPMPLAVKAFAVNEVPQSLTLSDADAMMPTRPLSSAQNIEVSARISLSGSVSRASGDWEGIANQPDPQSPNDYRLQINQKIE